MAQRLIISGIQQLGIGVADVHKAWKWYRRYFGMNIKVFEERAIASYMLPYTGGQPQSRHAVLALNLNGGGGFEIWQYTERTPQPPAFAPALGDLGIFVAKIKTRDVQLAHSFCRLEEIIVSDIQTDPVGRKYFFATDPFGNIFQVIESLNWFGKSKKLTGAVYGAVIGVSNIENARKVYSEILGYDKVVLDQTGSFADFGFLYGGERKCRRVVLAHSMPRLGAFSRLFGESEIELIEVKEHPVRKIYENRFWGDLGFIHLCFDINGFQMLKELCAEKGFPFTVDSSASQQGDSFDMGEAAGHFSYIADPDGTLIEFVETHKVPILKNFGWYLDLRKRKPGKHLPNWMIKAMGMNKVKD